MNTTERDKLVEEYADLPRVIAARKFPHLQDVFEDLICEGNLALVKSAARYTPQHEATFTTFATYRIHGAMLDYLRDVSSTGRVACFRLKKINKARTSLYYRGEYIDDDSLMEEAGLTAGQYRYAISAIAFTKILSLDEVGENDTDSQYDLIPDMTQKLPGDDLEAEEWFEYLLIGCSDREKYILREKYVNRVYLRKIAENLGLTESWVSQKHNEVLGKIRSRLKEKGIELAA